MQVRKVQISVRYGLADDYGSLLLAAHSQDNTTTSNDGGEGAAVPT